MPESSTKPLPPGTSGLPLLGETLPFLRDIFGFVSARLGDGIFRTSVLGQPTIIMAGPEACSIFIDEQFIQREGSFPRPVQELFGGRSLPLLDGHEHRIRKSMVMQAFTPEALASYLPTLERTTASALARWAKAGSFGWLDEMKRLAIEGICASIFGLEPGPEMDAILADYRLVTRGFTGLPVNIPGTAYAAALKARDRILDRLAALALARQQHPTHDGLSRLVAARGPGGEQMSIDQLKLELHHIVIAGLIIFAEFAATVMALEASPQVLEKLRQEVRATQGPLTHEALRQMPYLLRVVMEVKRSCRNVPLSFGKARKSFEYRGYHVPEGWLVFLAVGENNHWKESFPDPERFDPDRFSDERAEHRSHPHAYVPQGAGDFQGHKCAGLDLSTLFMQLFAALLVRDYTWQLPPQDMSFRMDIMPPEPRDGLKAVVTAR